MLISVALGVSQQLVRIRHRYITASGYQLEECLTECHLSFLPAGMPRKPGMTMMTYCQGAPRSLWEILPKGYGESDCEPCVRGSCPV